MNLMNTTMPKVLKPYTIIPNNLYIQRDADRQLKNIINDMGRPGYVLVSRQMGKTNLLLNAKRRLEGNDDVFLYIDLSNTFNDAKSCFENIIDTAIDTNPEKFNSILDIIISKRKELKDIPSHKQHTNELRLLLNAISGKFVIILDEIDALTKTSYSDQIFAQIRSTYFSRVNYPELERLTYILSGVIEPSEIIKDPRISPFNIGQKIFLNDFNINEFKQLLTNSNIIIDQEIQDRIFFWTNGNPRITWDVCSEVENIMKIEKLTVTSIDKIVNSLYLTTFDKPPIDHIRELIKEDKELRNSIIEIEYKKGKEVSDKIKNKLYLSGIINYNENEIHIKNEIIKRALNLEWINSIDEEEKGLIKVAIDYYEKHNYADCLKAFNNYLTNNEFPKHNESLYFYFMGHSAFSISDFNSSLIFFKKTSFDKEDEAVYYYQTLNFKGLLYYYLKDIDLSLDSFKAVLSRTKKDEIFARALVNFGSISVNSKNPNHIDDAKKIFHDIIDENEIDSSKISIELLNEFKAISFNNLSLIELSKQNTAKAIEYYKKAIEIAPEKTKIKITLSLIHLINDKAEKENLLKSIVEIIIDSQVIPKKFDPDNPMSFDLEQFNEVVFYLFSLDDKSLFEKIQKYIYLLGENNLGKNLYNIALYGIKEDIDIIISVELLIYISSRQNNLEYKLDDKTLYNTFKIIAYYLETEEKSDYLKKYIDYFNIDIIQEIDYFDIKNFARYIYFLIEKNNFSKVLICLEKINNAKYKLSDKYLLDFLIIFNLSLNIHTMLFNEKKAIDTAQEILNLINNNDIKNNIGYLVKEKEISIIKANAESTLKLKSSSVEKDPGRNDYVKVKYKDGRIITIKLKRVINDINSGLCVIIN